MQSALIGSILLAISACPIGVFLMLRGMSLTGDAMSHAILPGVAIAFLFCGFSLISMTIGGFLAGIVVVLATALISRNSPQKEDASMAVFYLIALASGVIIVSLKGSTIDLLHLLFGSVLAITPQTLWLITAIMLITVSSLRIFWRALAMESLDPLLFRSLSPLGKYVHISLLGLMVLNLVGGFQSLGTLLSIGLMMIPAITARFWFSRLIPICVLSIILGIISSIFGLLLSFHISLPSGPAIIMAAGLIYLVSCFISPRGLAAAWSPCLFCGSPLSQKGSMRKLVKKSILFSFFLFFLSFPFPAAAHKTIKVVASFSIIADFVKNVGRDRVSITTFVGPNGNTHIYEPTPHDAKALKNARIIFVNGLYLEDFIDKLITATDTKALLVKVSDNISPINIENQERDAAHHHLGNIDPHAWQAVPNAKIYIKNIAAAFCKIDQQSCENYNKNADAYIQKLDATQAIIKAQIAAIPKNKRTIITSHDAFGYFAHEYNFTILAPENTSTETEATAADVAKLIKQIKSKEASALFVENISNPRLIEQISKETGLKVGGTLYSDALSEKDGPAATYLDMMTHNVTTIVDAIIKR